MKTKIAVSGDAGSFSEEAGLLYAKKNNLDPELIYAIDMEGVLKKLDEGAVELGIFPVVNSIGGLVQQAFKAMGGHLFNYIDELPLEINQCLMVKPGTSKEQITAITSHPQALRQCAKYLKKEFPNAKIVEWIDTAKAAKDLSEGTLPSTTAVIAPARSAQIYGLEMLEKGIQDIHPNITTFIIVKK